MRGTTNGVAAAVLALGLGGWTAASGGAAQAAATPTCFGVKATIVGSARSTTIRGTSHDDVIYAGNGNDTVYGGGGNDRICGGYGADRLHGGAGDDWLDGGYGNLVVSGATRYVQNDVLYADAGDDFLSPVFDGRARSYHPDVISFAEAPHHVVLNAVTHVAVGSGTDRWVGQRAEIVGSRGADTFSGTPGNDVFDGGPGPDVLNGFGGNDVLRDGDGSGTKSADRLSGGLGNDQLITVGGHDSLDGGDGNDTLDDFSRWAGTMLGGAGNDVINDGIEISASQTVDGGSGVDKVSLYPDRAMRSLPRLAVNLAAQTGTFRTRTPVTFKVAGAERLYLHGVPLTFTGDSGDNVVWSDGVGGPLSASGGGGNDTFYGTAGNDIFNGGTGFDTAVLRGGADRCLSIERTSARCAAP